MLHGGNGSTLKATTVRAMMNWLGLKASYSRPRVSDDNSFVEALFRTAKIPAAVPGEGLRGPSSRPGRGRAGSSIGTTTSTDTVASATSARHSAMPAGTAPSCRLAMNSTRMQGHEPRGAGHGTSWPRGPGAIR